MREDMNHLDRIRRRRRHEFRATALIASVVLGMSGIAAASDAAPALQLTLARSGEAAFRVELHQSIGAESTVVDARASDLAKRVRSERTDRGLRLLVAADGEGGAGDLVRLTIADVPGGIVAASTRVRAADGTEIGHVEVFGESLYVTWYAGEAARRGGEVVIEFDALGLPVLPGGRR